MTATFRNKVEALLITQFFGFSLFYFTLRQSEDII